MWPEVSAPFQPEGNTISRWCLLLWGGRQPSLVQTSALKADYSLLALSSLNWRFRPFYKKAPLARVVEKWWMTSSSRSHVLCGHEPGRRGHPGATLLPRQALPPAATRAPSAHRTATRRPPANPRDPRPPRLQPEPPGRAGPEPENTGHHLSSESVASLLPRAGLGGLEKRFSKSIPCRGPGSCPVDSHRCVRSERKYPEPRWRAAHAPPVPSPHARFYPQRLRPNFMLVFSDPFFSKLL